MRLKNNWNVPLSTATMSQLPDARPFDWKGLLICYVTNREVRIDLPAGRGYRAVISGRVAAK
jgi:hypothetical protein